MPSEKASNSKSLNSPKLNTFMQITKRTAEIDKNAMSVMISTNLFFLKVKSTRFFMPRTMPLKIPK